MTVTIAARSPDPFYNGLTTSFVVNMRPVMDSGTTSSVVADNNGVTTVWTALPLTPRASPMRIVNLQSYHTIESHTYSHITARSRNQQQFQTQGAAVLCFCNPSNISTTAVRQRFKSRKALGRRRFAMVKQTASAFGPWSKKYVQQVRKQYIAHTRGTVTFTDLYLRSSPQALR